MSNPIVTLADADTMENRLTLLLADADVMNKLYPKFLARAGELMLAEDVITFVTGAIYDFSDGDQRLSKQLMERLHDFIEALVEDEAEAQRVKDYQQVAYG